MRGVSPVLKLPHHQVGASPTSIRDGGRPCSQSSIISQGGVGLGGVGEGGWGKGGLGNGGDHECSRRCHELHLSLLDFVADCVSTPHMAQAISDVVGWCLEHSWSPPFPDTPYPTPLPKPPPCEMVEDWEHLCQSMSIQCQSATSSMSISHYNTILWSSNPCQSWQIHANPSHSNANPKPLLSTFWAREKKSDSRREVRWTLIQRGSNGRGNTKDVKQAFKWQPTSARNNTRIMQLSIEVVPTSWQKPKVRHRALRQRAKAFTIVCIGSLTTVSCKEIVFYAHTI